MVLMLLTYKDKDERGQHTGFSFKDAALLAQSVTVSQYSPRKLFKKVPYRVKFTLVMFYSSDPSLQLLHGLPKSVKKRSSFTLFVWSTFEKPKSADQRVAKSPRALIIELHRSLSLVSDAALSFWIIQMVSNRLFLSTSKHEEEPNHQFQ